MEHLDTIPSDYRLWLQQEYSQRSRKNPRYSIRAFAKVLAMDPSSVSQIISGKRRVSAKILQRLCDRLSVAPLVRAELFKSIKTPSDEAAQAAPAYTQLAADAFAIISDWYHCAILELTFCEEFESSPKWIAQKLGISVTDSKIALDRLLRLELLEIENGRLVKSETFLTNYSEGFTAPALKELQRQLLHKALHAIDHIEQPKKDITSMTMAIDPAKLPAAKNRIKKFRRELCAFLENGRRTVVYNLGIQLFPLSTPEPTPLSPLTERGSK